MTDPKEPVDESTTYVSAQPGAPLPAGFSEDTVVGASLPGTTEDPVPATEIVADQGNGVAEETIITTSNMGLGEFDERTVTGDSGGSERVLKPERSTPMAPAPSVEATVVGVPEAPIEVDIDREILESFDPLADNEELRVHGIRTVDSVVDPSTVAQPARPESVRIKAPQTAQQLWKKNQARRKQQRMFIVVFMVVMAAVGVLAAVVASTLFR